MMNRCATAIVVGVTIFSFVKCLVYRLPKDVAPLRYTLTMEPHLSDEWLDYKYSGSVIIELKVLSATKSIVLHSHYLGIDIASIKVDYGKESIDVLETSSNRTTETYTIHLANELLGDEYYNLTIGHFSGHLDSSQGFFFARYWTANATRRTIAATHFEPSNARNVFPCFDEPALKATFVISIIRKRKYISLSNEDLELTEDLGNGRFKDTFRETPQMSTFLVAFTVSDFKATAKKERHRIFGRPEIVENGDLDYPLEVAVKTLQILEDFTGINYTLSKMDQFAVPEGYFPYHAMENWGLVVYGENYIRCTPKTPISDLKRITTYIAHEFAHQWFGNLVTPEWWDYLWLSESLAAYLQYYIASIVLPTAQLMDEFVIDILQTGFVMEEFIKASPLNYQIQYSEEVPPLHIMYKKGNSIVRMMAHFLGHSVFQKGLQIYLQNRKFSTAVPADLYNALQESVRREKAGYLLQNMSVAEILGTWDATMGFPTVTVMRNYATGSLLLVQNSIFNNSGCKVFWKIPINYVFSTGGKPDFSKTTADFWLTEKFANVDNSFPTTGWLLVNKQQTGYYRVNYDLENWERLIRFLKSDRFESIHVLNRAQLISDAFYFAYHREIPLDVPLRLCEYLVKERNAIPWAAFRKGMLIYLHIHVHQWTKEELEYFRSHSVSKIVCPQNYYPPNPGYRIFFRLPFSCLDKLFAVSPDVRRFSSLIKRNKV